MRPFFLPLLLSLSLLLAAPPACAGLTLSQAEALWRQHSRELKLAAVAVDAAAADRVTAGQRPNPDLALNTLAISPWSGYRSGGWERKKMDTVLRVEQLIERGGKRELRQRGADERLAAVRFDAEEIGRQQLLDLRGAYFDLRLSQERLRLAQETAALYRRSVEAGQLRKKAGDIAPVDLTRLQIDLARAETELRAAQAGREQAQQALAYLIGSEAQAGELVATDDWPLPNADELQSAGLDARPDLAAARRRVAAAEAERDLARAKRTRDLTVGVQYEHNLQNAPTNSYGFGVSVPLFLWHEHEGEIARADADFNAARLQLEQLQAQVGGEVAVARSALLAARDRLRRIEDGLLADARRVAEAAEFAYRRGAMGLLDLLDARRTQRQVEAEALNARADYARAWAAWTLQANYKKTASGYTP